MNGGCEEKGLEKNEYNAFLIQKNKIQILIVIKSWFSIFTRQFL